MSFSLRCIQAADLDAVHRLHRRIEDHDRIPIATPREEFLDWLEEPHVDLATDSRLVEVGGDVVAWGRISYRPGGEREERAFLFGAVHPAHRGRGIGAGLFQWQLERAGEILRTAPTDLPRYVRTQAYDFQHSAMRLYARHAMTPVRYIEELLRDLDALPRVPQIAGIAIIGWDPLRSEDARVARNDAFSDHWGSVPRDPAAWRHDLAAFGTRLDLSFLAVEGERVVGVCRNGHFPGDETVNGRRDGWIMQVSVVRPYRKRGIASALIATSLHAFKAEGLTHAALAVDRENATGAYELYARLGFQPMHRSVVFQRRG